MALVQEQCRDTRRIALARGSDARSGLCVRTMRRTPGHTAVATLSLAVAIGANTTTFSLVNTLLLRELPVSEPQELVELGRETSSGPGNFSYPLYERVRDQNRTLTDVIAVSSPVMRAEDGEFGSAAAGTLCLRKLLRGARGQSRPRPPAHI